MSTTTNLGLTITPSTAGSVTTFYNWRLALNGESPTSNMNLIDTWAGGVNGSIVTLQGNKPTIYVNGIYVSPGFYTATGITSITAYTTNMFIDLTLDTTITGTTTLNINSLGTKTLQKVDASGSVVNLSSGDLKKNKEYIFRYNGSAWIWIGAASADQINIYGSQGNLVAISGSVLVDSGVALTTGSKIIATAIPTGSGLVITSGSLFANIQSPITLSSGSISHATTGVSGSYSLVEVNSYGHVVSGSSDVLRLSTRSASPMNTSACNISLWSDKNGSLHVAGSSTDYQLDNYSNNYNLIIDGGFQVAQAYPTTGSEVLNPATGTYPIFDVWKYSIDAQGGSSPSIKISQRSTGSEVSGASYCYKINVSGSGSGYGGSALHQNQVYIERGSRYLGGKQMTVSFYARSTIANKRIGVFYTQGYGTGGSPSSQEIISGSSYTLTSTFQRFSNTFVLNGIEGKTFGTNTDDYLKISFCLMWGVYNASRFFVSDAETFVGSGDIEITNVQIDFGPVALPWRQEAFGDVLRKCQRYFRKSYKYSVAIGTAAATQYIVSSAISTATLLPKINFEEMRIPAVLSLYSYNGNSGKVSLFSNGNDIGTVISWIINTNGISKIDDSGSNFIVGTMYIFHYVADARF